MGTITDMIVNKDDLGKKMYRQKTTYNVIVEQDVLANNQDEAQEKFLEGGGIDHDTIRTNLTNENDGVETYYIEAKNAVIEKCEMMGKVVYSDDEFAKENGDVEIDFDAKETFSSPYIDGEGI
jgi:hypothetical protein|tara:strand:- start:1681 stop:2049 length:369 start_codon:yes stop_codon:yes gene_type:complete